MVHMLQVVLLALEKIILHLWNREIQTNKINFILCKSNEYQQKTALKRCRFLTISNKLLDVALSFSKIFEKLPQTFVKLCNFSKN